jgi:hypothetical protein
MNLCRSVSLYIRSSCLLLISSSYFLAFIELSTSLYSILVRLISFLRLASYCLCLSRSSFAFRFSISRFWISNCLYSINFASASIFCCLIKLSLSFFASYSALLCSMSFLWRASLSDYSLIFISFLSTICFILTSYSIIYSISFFCFSLIFLMAHISCCIIELMLLAVILLDSAWCWLKGPYVILPSLRDWFLSNPLSYAS